MNKSKIDCTCFVDDDEYAPTDICFCPLHKAAEKMYKALKTLLFACRDGAVLPRDCAHKQARDAIEAAEEGE